jgi:hypothetical protein
MHGFPSQVVSLALHLTYVNPDIGRQLQPHKREDQAKPRCLARITADLAHD